MTGTLARAAGGISRIAYRRSREPPRGRAEQEGVLPGPGVVAPATARLGETRPIGTGRGRGRCSARTSSQASRPRAAPPGRWPARAENGPRPRRRHSGRHRQVHEVHLVRPPPGRRSRRGSPGPASSAAAASRSTRKQAALGGRELALEVAPGPGMAVARALELDQGGEVVAGSPPRRRGAASRRRQADDGAAQVEGAQALGAVAPPRGRARRGQAAEGGGQEEVGRQEAAPRARARGDLRRGSVRAPSPTKTAPRGTQRDEAAERPTRGRPAGRPPS